MKESWVAVLQKLHEKDARNSLQAIDYEKLIQEVNISLNNIQNVITYLEKEGYIIFKERQIGSRILRKLYLTDKGINWLEGEINSGQGQEFQNSKVKKVSSCLNGGIYDLGEQRLPFTLRKKIVNFLTLIPNIHDSNALRAFLYSAGLDTQLQNQINIAGPPAQFFQLLVPILSNYGILKDGRNALKAVLESAKDYVGQQGREYCDTLIQELDAVLKGEN